MLFILYVSDVMHRNREPELCARDLRTSVGAERGFCASLPSLGLGTLIDSLKRI